jgi:hypothetical protein
VRINEVRIKGTRLPLGETKWRRARVAHFREDFFSSLLDSMRCPAPTKTAQLSLNGNRDSYVELRIDRNTGFDRRSEAPLL